MMNTLSKPTSVLLLLLAALAWLLVGLSHLDLHDSTEPREAGVSAEMLQDGDFLMPRLNGQPFLEKPPLSYWLQSQSIRVLGYTNLAPRLPSVLAGVGCVLLLFFGMARERNATSAGVAAGLLLLTMGSFWSHAREAGQDALLTFGVCLTLLSFFHARQADRPALGWFGYVLGLSVATLAKGVVGLAIPGVAILAYLLIESIWLDHRWVPSHWLRPAGFALIALAPLGLWLYLLYRRHGIGPVQEVVWANSVGRFRGEYSQGAHAEPWYFYLMQLPQAFQPWTLPLFVACWRLRGSWRSHRSLVFLACWLIAGFVLLSLSAGKRPSYMLPLYPAAAMLIVHYAFEDNTPAGMRVLRRLTFVEALIITGIAIAVLLSLRLILSPTLLVAAIVVALAALALLWRSVVKANWPAAFIAGSATIGLAYMGQGALVLPEKVNADSMRRVFEQLPRADVSPGQVILFKPTERVAGAARYYLGGPVAAVATSSDLAAAWARSPGALALIRARDAGDVTGAQIQRRIGYGADEYWIASTEASEVAR